MRRGGGKGKRRRQDNGNKRKSENNIAIKFNYTNDDKKKYN